MKRIFRRVSNSSAYLHVSRLIILSCRDTDINLESIELRNFDQNCQANSSNRAIIICLTRSSCVIPSPSRLRRTNSSLITYETILTNSSAIYAGRQMHTSDTSSFTETFVVLAPWIKLRKASIIPGGGSSTSCLGLYKSEILVALMLIGTFISVCETQSVGKSGAKVASPQRVDFSCL